jgi:membrane-associated phospholipid phosphatase
MLNKKSNLFLILGAVFAVNYVETFAETWLKNMYGIGLSWGHLITVAFQQFENNLSFENHDATSWVAVYGYSIAYFFFLPVLGVLVAACLARRKNIAALRALCLAIAFDYLVSLPFFLFFPVPERWTSADSAAILLSDEWSSQLIEVIRPLSGLDNSFPSFHVSLTVVIVLICFVFKFRFRITAAVLGSLVVISTFILGIHWLPDIIAGFAVGTLSVLLATTLASRADKRRLQPV